MGIKPCRDCCKEMSVTDPLKVSLWCVVSLHNSKACDNCAEMSPKAIWDRKAKLYVAKHWKAPVQVPLQVKVKSTDPLLFLLSLQKTFRGRSFLRSKCSGKSKKKHKKSKQDSALSSHSLENAWGFHCASWSQFRSEELIPSLVFPRPSMT